jgi:hypothetical protein
MMQGEESRIATPHERARVSDFMAEIFARTPADVRQKFRRLPSDTLRMLAADFAALICQRLEDDGEEEA